MYRSNRTALSNEGNVATNVASWSYIRDTNFQLRGNTLIGDMAYWGRNK